MVSVATGAIPGSDGTINACYGGNGELRVIDVEKTPPATCSKGFKPLSWNQRGPQGEPGVDGRDGVDGQDGAPGETGQRGPSNVFGTFKDVLEDVPDATQTYGADELGQDAVVTLPLPAGLFHIQAKVVANGPAPNEAVLASDTGDVGCALVAGPNVDGARANVLPLTLTAKGSGDQPHGETLAMQVLHGFTEPGQVELRCTDYGDEGASSLSWIKVHATQVGSISNPPAP